MEHRRTETFPPAFFHLEWCIEISGVMAKVWRKEMSALASGTFFQLHLSDAVAFLGRAQQQRILIACSIIFSNSLFSQSGSHDMQCHPWYVHLVLKCSRTYNNICINFHFSVEVKYTGSNYKITYIWPLAISWLTPMEGLWWLTASDSCLEILRCFI